jgi:predicted dehydrogenase
VEGGMKPVNWGILSTAKIGMDRVVPPMMTGQHCKVVAIASRALDKAQEAAAKLGIAKAYGSYEELLADKSIEAIYNPLPNHMHVAWTIKAAEAGKHVLCEKPIGLTAAEAQKLIDARDRNKVLIMEAFMVRSHPQWLAVRDLVRQGRIGELRAVQMFFSYYNVDPANIRNKADIGGGGLMDIGCYPITLARFLFESEPSRLAAIIERDPDMKTDRLTSAMLDFPTGQASFTCSTQLARFQRTQIVGTKGRIEVEIPVNAPDDRPLRLLLDPGLDNLGSGIEVIAIPPCNQYQIQGDLFSEAIRGVKKQTLTLEDSIANMRVIDAVVRAAESSAWEKV